MTATYTDPIRDYTVPLHFKHRMSTVEVRIERNDGVREATMENVKTYKPFQSSYRRNQHGRKQGELCDVQILGGGRNHSVPGNHPRTKAYDLLQLCVPYRNHRHQAPRDFRHGHPGGERSIITGWTTRSRSPSWIMHPEEPPQVRDCTIRKQLYGVGKREAGL